MTDKEILELLETYVEVDWSIIDQKFQWVAVQPDLTVHAFQNQPRIVNGSWWVVKGGAAASLDLVPYTPFWALSLKQRPKEVS